MINILVCGGRDFANVPTKGYGNGPDKDRPDYIKKWAELRLIHRTLDKIASERSSYYNEHDNWLPTDFHIIAGKAKGADSGAVDWAVVNWVSFKEYPADWSKYGKRAGYIRNKQMLEEGKPDLVIAFPGGRGTAMMVDLAKKAGVEVIEVAYERV